MKAKEIRTRFEKETGKKIEVTRTFDCEDDKVQVEIDVWNDNYIFWLESKLSEANEKLKETNDGKI